MVCYFASVFLRKIEKIKLIKSFPKLIKSQVLLSDKKNICKKNITYNMFEMVYLLSRKAQAICKLHLGENNMYVDANLKIMNAIYMIYDFFKCSITIRIFFCISL